MANNSQNTLGGFAELARMVASVELWGDEFQAAGRSGAPVGQATIEDGDLALTVSRWLKALNERSSGSEAAEGVAMVLSWLAARHALGQAEATEFQGADANARAAEIRERWSELLAHLYAN